MKPGQLQTLFNMFETLSIEQYRKTILQERYLDVLEDFQRRADRLTIVFYGSKIIITVGSILVPAFLSIQGASQQNQLYWATWVISLAVTICNGLITLFKLDKKYFFIHTTLELLKSEGWQYIGLCGRYAPKDSPIPPTHENQFLIFFHMAEKIKMRQVEEEYWKFTDTSGVGNATSQKLLPSTQTPATQQGVLALLPIEKKAAIEGWLEDMRQDNMMHGLAPRKRRVSILDRIIPRNNIDGTPGPPTLSKTPEHTKVPMQLDLREDASPEAAVVSTPQIQREISENSFITMSI